MDLRVTCIMLLSFTVYDQIFSTHVAQSLSLFNSAVELKQNQGERRCALGQETTAIHQLALTNRTSYHHQLIRRNCFLPNKALVFNTHIPSPLEYRSIIREETFQTQQLPSSQEHWRMTPQECWPQWKHYSMFLTQYTACLKLSN